MTSQYDVIVVGAGLAGLTAAHALSGYDVLLLEKETCAGGRVQTRSNSGVAYELGAIFPYCKDVLPFSFEGSPRLEEPGPVGICLDGKVHYGATVIECVAKLGHDMLERALELIRHGSFRSLSERAYRVVNGFFRVIHPANMESYLPQRRLDALLRFDTGHYRDGNGELVAEYLRRIPGRLETGADVLRVSDEGDKVRVVYRHQGCEKEAVARSAVITAPAPVAAGMLVESTPETRRFLDSVRFGAGAVVVVAFQEVTFRDFSYLVTPDAPFNAVISSRSALDGVVVLTAYYIGNNVPGILEHDASELIDVTLEALSRLGVGEFSANNVMFTDARYWENIGPRISAESYGNWQEGLRRPSGRVVLAGDYVCAGDNSMMPYGMTAAIQSGLDAAQDLMARLAGVD